MTVPRTRYCVNPDARTWLRIVDGRLVAQGRGTPPSDLPWHHWRTGAEIRRTEGA